jgi:hypothetical protein
VRLSALHGIHRLARFQDRGVVGLCQTGANQACAHTSEREAGHAQGFRAGSVLFRCITMQMEHEKPLKPWSADARIG